MAYTQESIHRLVEKQNAFFRTGTTLNVSWRKEQLLKLKDALQKNRTMLEQALGEDLGRTPSEAYFCDIGATILEINETLHGLKKWAGPETRFSGFVCFPSLVTKVYKMPYGTVLIISPFNFPILLTLGVLTAAIAGGNTAILKTSSKSPACTAALKKLISGIFPEEYCTVIDGGHDVADMCLSERFDKIFYTGSPKVAKHVMEMASKNLTPVALELGGETGNWCIVRKDADIEDAARKIAFFKTCNSGQICININQVAVAEEIADKFLNALRAAFKTQIGEGADAVNNPEYPRLISAAAYDKCAAEADRYRDRILFGGTGERQTQRYAPTVIYPVGKEEPIVNHELFCPLLPVVPFKDEEWQTVLDTVAEREHGLALYIFTKDIRWAKSVFASQQYGGGCINEVCLQLMVKGAPFNGTGHSGMGAYHGIWGFREFTHPSTVLIGKNKGNLSLREHPYTGKTNAWKLKLTELFER